MNKIEKTRHREFTKLRVWSLTALKITYRTKMYKFLKLINRKFIFITCLEKKWVIVYYYLVFFLIDNVSIIESISSLSRPVRIERWLSYYHIPSRHLLNTWNCRVSVQERQSKYELQTFDIQRNSAIILYSPTVVHNEACQDRCALCIK